MCYTWAGYDEMGAKYYLSFRGKKTANDFNITLLVSTFLNPLIEMVFQDHLKSLQGQETILRLYLNLLELECLCTLFSRF